MPLRKLLCETKKSVLLKLKSDFKMPILSGQAYDGAEGLHMEIPPFVKGDESSWILVEDWLQQRIAYYDKSADDIPYGISDETYTVIMDKLKKEDKALLDGLYSAQTILYQGEPMVCYIINNPDNIFDRGPRIHC